jgi:hypothetical protein
MPVKEVTPMPENISLEQIVEATTQQDEEYGAQIPEYAILRLARFFLSKIQENAENNDK